VDGKQQIIFIHSKYRVHSYDHVKTHYINKVTVKIY